MAAIVGKTIFHPNGSEEDIPVVQLKAAQGNNNNINNSTPEPLELEPLELNIDDWDSLDDEESREEPLLLYELPNEVAALKATVARQEKQIQALMKQNKFQGEALGQFSWIAEQLKEIDMSKLPRDPKHPNVRAQAYQKQQAELSRLKAELEAKNNSFDSVWEKHT